MLKTAQNCIYEGSWDRDMKHGAGKELYSNGDMYEGTFELNRVSHAKYVHVPLVCLVVWCAWWSDVPSGSFHVNSTTDFGSCSQIYLPLPIFVGHDVLCTFTKYCVLNDVCLQNMAL